jgi:hypothetical protein
MGDTGNEARIHAEREGSPMKKLVTTLAAVAALAVALFPSPAVGHNRSCPPRSSTQTVYPGSNGDENGNGLICVHAGQGSEHTTVKDDHVH